MLVLLKLGHFSMWTQRNWEFRRHRNEVWIGNFNVKAWKTTEHKLHKIWRSTKILHKFRKTSTPQVILGYKLVKVKFLDVIFIFLLSLLGKVESTLIGDFQMDQCHLMLKVFTEEASTWDHLWSEREGYDWNKKFQLGLVLRSFHASFHHLS